MCVYIFFLHCIIFITQFYKLLWFGLKWTDITGRQSSTVFSQNHGKNVSIQNTGSCMNGWVEKLQCLLSVIATMPSGVLSVIYCLHHCFSFDSALFYFSAICKQIHYEMYFNCFQTDYKTNYSDRPATQRGVRPQRTRHFDYIMFTVHHVMLYSA